MKNAMFVALGIALTLATMGAFKFIPAVVGTAEASLGDCTAMGASTEATFEHYMQLGYDRGYRVKAGNRQFSPEGGPYFFAIMCKE